MKFSFKKIVIWLLLIVAVAVVLVQPGTQRGKYIFQVETVSNTCTFDEYKQESVESTRDSIVIIEPIQTATPCYDIEGSVNFFGSDIAVNLQAKKKGDTCAECIGIVVAKVTISNLDKGTYDLQISAPDRSILKTVRVE